MMLQTEYFDDIFAEAFACFEQGLSYDEVGDKVLFCSIVLLNL